jgi:hypothetical protein
MGLILPRPAPRQDDMITHDARSGFMHEVAPSDLQTTLLHEIGLFFRQQSSAAASSLVPMTSVPAGITASG